LGDVSERKPQLPQPERRPDDVTVQGDPHDERLPLRLSPHLLEMIDDHIGDGIGAQRAGDIRWNVV
jgi:hypothetical protein